MSIPTADISSRRNGKTPEPELPQQVRSDEERHGPRSGLPPEWSHSAPWRQTVQRRRITLMNEVARLQRCGAPSAACSYLVDDLLEDANRASLAKVTLRKWWWGTEIERAWARLREVEERIVELARDEDLPVYAAHAAHLGQTYLGKTDSRVTRLRVLRRHAAQPDTTPQADELRRSIIAVLWAAHDIADCVDREARYLRNRLLIASGFCVLFAIVMVCMQSRLEWVKFIEHANGWKESSWSYLGIVMLFGAVGSLFTTIPAVSRIPSNFGPFNLPLQQGLLKIAFGPLAAVTGLGALMFVPAKLPDSLSAILLLAVIFGAGQHAVTRYVDQRAEEILTAAAPSTSRK